MAIIVSRDSETFPLWEIPFHVLALICLFSIIYISAKSISTTEATKSSTATTTFQYFVAIWFFPIGVFYLQPKLNKMARIEKEQA
jgi:hypothetical protein